MKRYIQLYENRIVAMLDEDPDGDDDLFFEYDFPDDFDFDQFYEYTIVDDELVYSKSEETLRSEEFALSAAKRQQSEIAMQFCVMNANFTDEQALKVDLLYPDWEVGTSYATGNICRYQDNLYRALQDSTAAAEHTPDISTSLWKQILPPDEETGILPWVQPLGATDAYMTGDKVSHNDKTWVSNCDNNVWEPGVYGWDEVTE